MQITREIGLDYGHTLPNHYSFCNQIHGHRARIIASVSGEIDKGVGTSSQGMVLDFKILKQVMMDYIHEALDHGFAVWEEDLEDLIFIKKRNKKYLITLQPPTAEYLAEWAFKTIMVHLPENIKMEKLVWYETPNSCATYTIEDYERES